MEDKATRDCVMGLWHHGACGQAALRRFLAAVHQGEALEAGFAHLIVPHLAAAAEREAAGWVALGQAALGRYRALGAEVLVLGERGYPPQMGSHRGAPPVLSYVGCPGLLSAAQIAVVGTRHPDAMGRSLGERVCRHLIEAGWVIVSGGALGIDALAHRLALSEGRPTVVVCGTGLDFRYPKRNADIYEACAGRGLIVSQFPLETAPRREIFPRRNATIAALARGSVVVQAPRGSGALHTARATLRLGRPLWVVAGPAFHWAYAGGLDLYGQPGVQVLRDTQDFPPGPAAEIDGANALCGQALLPLERPRGPARREVPVAMGRLERLLWQRLAQGEAVRDELLRLDGDHDGLCEALLGLELQGEVERQVGERYALRDSGA